MGLIAKIYQDVRRSISRYGREIPGILAQGKLARLVGVNPVRECAACRSLDNNLEDTRIAAFLLSEARSQGITIWQLPSINGLRLACDQAIGSAFTSSLETKTAGAGVSLKLQKEGPSPNIYEFNPEEFEVPPSATILQATAKPHCRRGLQYLPHRGVTLEFIDVREDEVIIPRSGLGSRIVAADEMAMATVAEVSDTRQHWPFPIDLVYTWVDSTDEIWKRNFEAVAHEIEDYRSVTSSTNMARWHSRDELRFSIRSVDMYAPWIRKIFVVTNGQAPNWLVQNERVQIVPHSALYPDPSVLPTFNSNSIETVLHRIEGLAEHFLYLNDDFFFSAPAAPSDFFSIGGAITLFFSSRYYDTRPVRPTDRATVAAHKTTGTLLEKKFGISCKQKFMHAPHAMRVSICEEACREFSEELAVARVHRFRSHSDIAGPYLFQYYAYLTGRGYSAQISAGYFDTQAEGFPAKFAARQAKGMKVFCINDSDLADDLVHTRDLMIAAFLTARFPKPTDSEYQPPVT